MRPRLWLSVAASLLALVSTESGQRAAGEDRWSGFQNGGELKVDADLPLTWSPDRLAWKADLAGYGQSTPVVCGARIYVTSVTGEAKQNGHVEALDSTGVRRWKHDFKTASHAPMSNYVSKAAPSPVCDDDGVIALFEGGDLLALSPEGKLRWRRDLVADYDSIRSRHGLGGSLEQDAKRVFVWIEREGDPYLLAVDKQSGETIWKVSGLDASSWSSPRLVPLDDSAHLVLSGIGKLAGVDPETGKRLWEMGGISGNSTPTPIPLGDGRFLMGATTGRGGEGGNAAESNGLVRIERDGDRFEPRYLWRADKATCSFGSPIAHDGHAYFINRAGVVYCLDLATGEQRYAERTAGSIWATPIAAGERIYLFGRSGETTVIASGPKFKQLAVNKLWDDDDAPPPGSGLGGPVLYAAAVMGDTLLLRRGDVLYAVGDEPSSGESP